MTRLREDGRTTFVILDEEPIYVAADLDAICASNRIDEAYRASLWQTLERAGRAYLDRRRIQSQPNKLARIRQDLRLGRQLASQLAEMAPDAGQIKKDRCSPTLSRCHLSALREGERRTGAVAPSGVGLDEIRETLVWLSGVYDEALDACTRAGDEADTVWREALTEYYTRTLTRPWTGDGSVDGEQFLADCREPLERCDALDVPPITALNLNTDLEQA